MDIERGGSAQHAFPEHYRAGFVSLVGRSQRWKIDPYECFGRAEGGDYIKSPPNNTPRSISMIPRF